ncbi:hypothetical protein GDO86_010855 [Hymenochirus boettgeri]|uniref:RRM domain-containing protein n=1 Tax=Hymenochirus boettgeri TaxID=247094 RepID=A0A8T2JEW5_9PIPI|nr:hypothetical protein GDO86_010855 [Hymenochirus boettgeri]
MSLVIRLQGLPLEANSLDIRHFFQGLNIPKGHIYITGGMYGEAFISFATYMDASQALNFSGGLLKNSPVQLSFSSQSEMQRALEVIHGRLNASAGASNGIPSYKDAVYFKKPNTSYVYIHGMPLNATRSEIKTFFAGLDVVDVVFLKHSNGIRNGNAVVRFGSPEHVNEALKRQGQLMGYNHVSLKLSDETEWVKAGGTTPRKREHSPTIPFKDRKKIVPRARSPPRKLRRAHSPYVEHYLHLINLSHDLTKRDIKIFFGHYAMKDSQINFLYDSSGRRTREGFVLFTSTGQYDRARLMHKKYLLNRQVDVLPISENAMRDLIARTKKKPPKERSSRKDSPKRSSHERSFGKGKYIYLRNFPSNVSKLDIQNFFTGQITEEQRKTFGVDASVGPQESNIQEQVSSSEVKDPSEESVVDSLKLEDVVSVDDNGVVEKSGLQSTGLEVVCEKPAESSKQDNFTEEINSTKKENVEKSGLQSTVSDVVCEKLQPAKSSASLEFPITPKQDNCTKENNSTEMDSVVEKSALPSTGLEVVCEDLQPAESSASLDLAIIPKKGNCTEEIISIEKDSNNTNIPSSPTEEVSPTSVVLVKNLPRTFTVTEAIDFFHGYKVKSVNLAHIENGMASVRLETQEEAAAAVKELNDKSVGLNTISLSLK